MNRFLGFPQINMFQPLVIKLENCSFKPNYEVYYYLDEDNMLKHDFSVNIITILISLFREKALVSKDISLSDFYKKCFGLKEGFCVENKFIAVRKQKNTLVIENIDGFNKTNLIYRPDSVCHPFGTFTSMPFFKILDRWYYSTIDRDAVFTTEIDVTESESLIIRNLHLHSPSVSITILIDMETGDVNFLDCDDFVVPVDSITSLNGFAYLLDDFRDLCDSMREDLIRNSNASFLKLLMLS